jgi:hypothetical protein
LTTHTFIDRLQILVEIAGNVPTLARNSGVSDPAIRKYLTGSEPSRSVLLLLAAASGVRSGWLADGLGNMCDPDSPVLQRARQLVAQSYMKNIGNPQYRECGLAGVAYSYADAYANQIEADPVPLWVRELIPAVDKYELDAWRVGQLTYSTARSRNAMISAPPLSMAKVSASIRRTLGPRMDGLTLEMEANLIARGCQHLLTFTGEDRTSAVLDAVVALEYQLLLEMSTHGDDS